MIQPKFITVLPKISSYDTLDSETRTMARNLILETVEWLESMMLVNHCIAEDELAYKLFMDKPSIKWISALSTMDSLYISKYTDIYDNYLSLSKSKYNQGHITKTSKSIKKPDEPEDSSNNEIYLSNVLKTILLRLRTTANVYMEDFPIVLYFSRGVSYTKKYTPKIGDGKFYIEVDLDTDLVHYFLGGVEVNKEGFEKLLQGVLG